MANTETFYWAIIEDGGVSDRYATREEAEDALSSYSAGAVVEYQPDTYFEG